jgi:hypothetical protein
MKVQFNSTNIYIELIMCPVLGIYGEQTEHSLSYRPSILLRLEAANK